MAAWLLVESRSNTWTGEQEHMLPYLLDIDAATGWSSRHDGLRRAYELGLLARNQADAALREEVAIFEERRLGKPPICNSISPFVPNTSDLPSSEALEILSPFLFTASSEIIEQTSQDYRLACRIDSLAGSLMITEKVRWEFEYVPWSYLRAQGIDAQLELLLSEYSIEEDGAFIIEQLAAFILEER